MNRKGFTLVEILIVISIILVMITILVGILNPIALVNKARDAQRKKDLNRIKISFEDYFNDKGCYPNKAKADELNLKSNCGSDVVFRPWMTTWPCDPNGEPYEVVVGYDENCPKWFKVLAVLENKNDKDIYEGVTVNGNAAVGSSGFNYGVSSGNITAWDTMGGNDPHCVGLGNCYYYPEPNMCNKIEGGCSGTNCFLGECSSRCQVNCCGVGCN